MKHLKRGGGLFRKLTNIPSVCLIKCHAQFESHLVSVTIPVYIGAVRSVSRAAPAPHTNHYGRTNKHTLSLKTDWQLATFLLPECFYFLES